MNGELNIYIDASTGLHIQADTLETGNPNNVIVPKRNPMVHTTKNSKLKLCLDNVRAIKSKFAALLHYFTTTRADLFPITETWLTPNDVAAKLEIMPLGYKFAHRCRAVTRCGGIGLLYKDSITVKKIEDGGKESFEFSEWKIVTGSFRARLVILYRAPQVTLRSILLPMATLFWSRNRGS